MGHAGRFAIVMLGIYLTGCSGESSDKQESPVPTTPVVAPANPAPDQYLVKFETTRGDFVIEVNRDWAPHGADRFYELVNQHFYDDCRFFRVARGFIVQCGINGDPAVQAKWNQMPIPDDSIKLSNKRKTVTFAMGGPNTRTTQFFINLSDTGEGEYQLDKYGFAPFGRVIAGMKVVDRLYDGYGEIPQFKGRGPTPQYIMEQGNSYLDRYFPKLDYIKRASILPLSERPTDEEKADTDWNVLPSETSADKSAEKAQEQETDQPDEKPDDPGKK